MTAALELKRHAWMLLLISLLVACPMAFAQDSRPTMPASELAQQNMERVAAAAAQIEAILRKDAGLMVELKRWIAKDATDHGQLVSDSDLTEEAIYNRVENDIGFRSVATALLQKFGYLLPQLNPNSPQGKEQALLIEERAKWLSQDEEEQLKQAHQQPANGGAPRSYPATEQPQGLRGLVLPQISSLSGNPSTPGVPQGYPIAQQPQEIRETFARENNSTTAGSKMSSMTQGSLPGLQKAQLTLASETGSSGSSLVLENDQDPTLPGLTSPNPAGGSESQTQFPLGIGPQMEFTGIEGSLPLDDSSADVTKDAVFERNPGHPPDKPILSQGMVRRADPYVDVPSLYDMYLQAAPQPTIPERFGMQVFQNGTRNAQMIPFDLPVGPDYVVGPGDSLAINLWGGVSQRLFRTVDKEGRVNLPESGPVLVAGDSLAQVQEAVQKTLRSQFRDVSADVSLSRLRTIRVYVVGDVEDPGAYDISSLSTPLNALFAAGGPTPQGSLRIVDHNRGDQTVQAVDVYDLLLHGVKTDIQRLENGDTVLVPPIGPEVTIEGMVRRPAVYELRNEKSLADVLTLAGGLLPSATLRHVEVQRVVAHQKRTMLSLDVPEDANENAIAKQLDSFQVQDGDQIRIFPIAPYDENSVYLEGHVLRPGKYSYRPGMRVTDLISSYKDLLPEPANQYAEIIRLDAPDYHPTVESFNLGNALTHPGSAPLLEPLDTLQIFGRYDFQNPPTVSVWGDVRVPGTYRTSGQLHLSDAIHMAGGLAPDAETEDAQIFRYLPDGKSKIFSVDLERALGGDPTENIVLDSRDRILVHRNPAEVNPASVYVKGEVARPGRYPLTTNMSVSDLVRAAGGLQPSADLQDADLTHYEWNGKAQMVGKHDDVDLNVAMTANSGEPLSNGDVLTVRELPGWNDLGATITVRGEVKHPGSYGIRPGEKLSSILIRAGGFAPDAYPYGALLERDSVRDLEAKSQQQLIERIKGMQTELKLTPTTDPAQKVAQDAAYQQWQESLEDLTNNSPLGRVTIQVSSNIRSWQNSSRDVAVRNGDTLIIPKRPSFVMVQGQVYNPTAVAYRPGRSAKWYLNQSGGATNLANKKAIFVVRADGTVIGGHGGMLWMGGGLEQTLQPGDTVVVPEKALGGPRNWQSFFQVVQVLSGVTTSAMLAAKY